MIIAFCGYAGAGKSTAAEYIAKEYGFKRHNFKDGLVAEMKDRFPNTLQLLANFESMLRLMKPGDYPIEHLFIDKPPVMRSLMQEYGTEVRRGDDPHYWTKKWKDTLPEGNIVVDDVRFANELEEVVKAGGVLIRIEKSNTENNPSHQSELEQEKFTEDFLIIADPGDVPGIHLQLEQIINILKSNVD